MHNTQFIIIPCTKESSSKTIYYYCHIHITRKVHLCIEIPLYVLHSIRRNSVMKDRFLMSIFTYLKPRVTSVLDERLNRGLRILCGGCLTILGVYPHYTYLETSPHDRTSQTTSAEETLLLHFHRLHQNVSRRF